MIIHVRCSCNVTVHISFHLMHTTISHILFPSYRLTEVVQKVSKKKIPSYANNLVFEICCDGEDGEDVEVPYIKYKFH